MILKRDFIILSFILSKITKILIKARYNYAFAREKGFLKHGSKLQSLNHKDSIFSNHFILRIFMLKKLSFWGISSGLVLGIFAPILVYLGNPGNMGVCAACFLRDTSGALGMQGAVQYARPEVLGIVIGALIVSLASGKFSSRGGASPIARFFLGVFGMFGALVFLGCPWRALLRLGAGDLSAIAGIVGLIAGILIGLYFVFKRGFSLGESKEQASIIGFIFPAFVLFILVMLFIGEDGVLKFSTKGPGSMHAAIAISLIAGLALGAVFAKSGFCTIGVVKTLIIDKNTALLQATIALLISTVIVNVILGQFNLGFSGQPIAHNDVLWNFLGMVLAGLCFTLGGGCPGRQLVRCGQGDNDSAVFVMGLIAGGALAHNFAIAASPKGIGANSASAVIIGIIFCLVLAFFAKAKA